ncbi:hypothetical protein [Streptomyces albipurpureus]|uniref:Uncharacterized protein n=1 Tax=Streptomyces albipurpureus TaxID=2897419 RepID=A0ABT0UE30_9ACTN|nr:hypothetical protein [Streptomyces sp. CWNU-1]MCM2386734.1 hypothetical protein [Streptomyces sp. CWNU-1]
MTSTTSFPADGLRPRLRGGVAVSAADGQVVFSAGQIRKRIGGGDALRLLLPVATAMDGRRTVGDLAAETDLPYEAVAQAVALLVKQGLVLSGEVSSTRPLAAGVVDYLELTAGTSASFRDASEVLERLSRCAVLIVAPPEHAEAIRDDLAMSGVGTVHSASTPAGAGKEVLDSLREAAGSLVVLHGPPRHDDGTDSFADDCARLDIAVLHYAAHQAQVDLGPLMHPRTTLCWRCFTSGYLAEFGNEQPSPAGAATGMVAAGLVAGEVLAYLADIDSMRTNQALVRWTLPDSAEVRYTVTAEAGCATCATTSRCSGKLAAVLEAYEDTVAAHPLADRPQPPVTAAQEKRLTALSKGRESFATAPVIPLPPVPTTPAGAPTGDELTAAEAAGVPDAAFVADLAAMVAGLRGDGSHRRWAASGGGLGSVELYLMCADTVSGLPAHTLLKYDDIGHRLLTTRRTHGPDMWQSMLDATGTTDSPDVVVVLVGALWRLKLKYGNFGMRLGHLDAGCALAQLHAVATDQGAHVTLNDHWQPTLPKLLELKEDEQVMATAGLWTPGARHATDQ